MIASKVPKCKTVFDIGTDHAYLPIFLFQENICKQAVACDIKNGPLRIAEKNIEKNNFQNNIKVVLSDGLSNVSPKENDVVVISGMGGLLISDIMNASKDKLKKALRIILQANTSIEQIREWLYNNDFEILDEALCKEDRRIYNVIVAKSFSHDNEAAYKTKLSRDSFVGQILIDNADPFAEEYFERMVKKYQKVMKGLEKSRGSIDKDNTVPEVEYFKQALSEIRRKVNGNNI